MYLHKPKKIKLLKDIRKMFVEVLMSQNLLIRDTKNDVLSEIMKVSLMILLLSFIVLNLFNNNIVTANPDNKSDVFCESCHPQEYSAWNHSAHGQSFSNPIFQEQWQTQDSPDACLSCHTTGYKTETGEFDYLNVGCELCHGPGIEMNVNITSSTCSGCHSVSHYPTYEEWLKSEHSHSGIGCNSCHDPMSLEIKTDDPNDLCTTCHATVDQEVLSSDHGAEGLECLDCHMITQVVDFKNGENGITGHSFFPGVPDPSCLSCHEINMDAHNIFGTESENCVMCHDEIYMTRLHLLNGTDVPITDSTLICAQCHNNIFYEWQTGLHSNALDTGKICTDCHSPMRPYIMIDETLPPISDLELGIQITQPIIPPWLLLLAVTFAIGITIYVFVLKKEA